MVVGVALELPGPRHDIGRHPDEGPERRAGLDGVLPPRPRGREHPRHRLHVVQEEALGVLSELVGACAAPDLLHRLEELHDLFGEGSLGDASAPGAQHLDLAGQRGGVVLVERADHVVGEGLVRVRV